ncbi:hypothetical protein ACWAVJ_001956, partial [Campylobacter jejuni]
SYYRYKSSTIKNTRHEENFVVFSSKVYFCQKSYTITRLSIMLKNLQNRYFKSFLQIAKCR